MPVMPFIPSTLTHWPVYCLKLGLASGLAWWCCQLTGVQDAVSATFVAVVCTMPTLTTGLRASTEQALGSLLGGGVATLLMLFGVSGPAGLALAVGLSAWFSYPVVLRPAGESPSATTSGGIPPGQVDDAGNVCRILSTRRRTSSMPS